MTLIEPSGEIKSPGTQEEINELLSQYFAVASKTPEPEVPSKEISSKLLADYTFTALFNLLGQLNPETIANQQQNQSPGTPKEVTELVFDNLTQNLGWDTQDANELINNYSTQSMETWGPLSTNLLQFLESQFNLDSISSQKQGAKETGSETTGKVLNDDSLTALFNLLGQLNSETVANQPNKPSDTPEAVNKFVLQYLTQSPLNNYSAQNNKTWGKSSKNPPTPLNVQFDLNSISAKTAETEIPSKETPGKSVNISNLLRFINDTKINTGQLTANNTVNTALGTNVVKHQSRLDQEGNNQGLSKANVVPVASETKTDGGKPSVMNSVTQEHLVPSIFRPNRGGNRRKSAESTLPKEPGNIQNASNDIIKATRSGGKETVNQSPVNTSDYIRNNPNNNQQPAPKNNDSPFTANKSESLNQQTAATTTKIKEINIGNKDTQNIQQIQLQPGRDSTPGIQQNLSNSGISQQVQLAARVAPLIQQAVSNNKGTTSLHLKLKPEHLGEVTIRLVYNQGSLQAHFVAANAHARELLDQSMVHLKENLLQLNINLNDASTSSGDESNKWGQQSPFQQKQRQARDNEPSLMSPEELVTDDPLNEAKMSENKGLNHLV
ncbi:MAG: hypothetical protein FH756_19435 [Firmicutes bacterium]|nr:hypothetical protein [Bacillota bacterium]